MGNKPPKTRQDFLEAYKSLCRRYGMLIEVNFAEGSTDGVMSVEKVITPDEIEEHLKELTEELAKEEAQTI
jgi:hypothetical protein